jgi:hypothetical protein
MKNDLKLAVVELIRAAKEASDHGFALGMQYSSPLGNEISRQSAMRENANLQVKVYIAIQAVQKTITQQRKAKP